MSRPLAPVAPTGVPFRVRTTYYSTPYGAGRIRVAVYVEGVGRVQTRSVPYNHAARDPHLSAIREAFAPSAVTVQQLQRGNYPFPDSRIWAVASDTANYAVILPNGHAAGWFADGNDAIAYRDELDKHAGRDRFASRVITSGQYWAGH